jgi:hypothetical protein
MNGYFFEFLIKEAACAPSNCSIIDEFGKIKDSDNFSAKISSINFNAFGASFIT